MVKNVFLRAMSVMWRLRRFLSSCGCCWCVRRSRTCGRCIRRDAGISSPPATASGSSMKTSWARSHQDLRYLQKRCQFSGDSLCLDVCFGFKRLFYCFSVKKSSTRCLLRPQNHCTTFFRLFWETLGFPDNVSTRICTRILLQRLESMMPKARWTFTLRSPFLLAETRRWDA